MPKFTVKTTVVYEFEVEAEDYGNAISEGHSFNTYQWIMEIEDIKAVLTAEAEQD